MKIPNEIRKAVSFLFYRNMVTGDYVPAGSAFYLGHDPMDGGRSSPRVYAVTARHVLDALDRRGTETVYLRVNTKGGQSEPLDYVEAPIKSWFTHPSDRSIDVAIFETPIPVGQDHLVMPMRMCLTDEVIRTYEVNLGDEVFIVGLFRHHYGKSKNIPIVRVGNLSALDEEPVATQLGEIRAYIIEARSIGGLSGSPVFLNLGLARIVNNQLKFTQGHPLYLLGLVHGHYDVRASQVTTAETDQLGLTNEKINAGIGIVVPVSDIRAVIEEYEKINPGPAASS